MIEFDWSDEHRSPSRLFSVRWEGFLVIPRSEGGPYTLSLRSDDASWLYLDGELLVDNGGIHTAALRSGLADLTPGPHELRIDYAELEPRLSLISFQWRAERPARDRAEQRALQPDAGDALSRAAGSPTRLAAVRRYWTLAAAP